MPALGLGVLIAHLTPGCFTTVVIFLMECLKGGGGDQSLRSVSTASKNMGADSGLGVLIAHFTPGVLTTVVSSIKKGIPRGIFAEK